MRDGCMLFFLLTDRSKKQSTRRCSIMVLSWWLDVGSGSRREADTWIILVRKRVVDCCIRRCLGWWFDIRSCGSLFYCSGFGKDLLFRLMMDVVLGHVSSLFITTTRVIYTSSFHFLFIDSISSMFLFSLSNNKVACTSCTIITHQVLLSFRYYKSVFAFYRVNHNRIYLRDFVWKVNMKTWNHPIYQSLFLIVGSFDICFDVRLRFGHFSIHTIYILCSKNTNISTWDKRMGVHGEIRG